MSTPTGLYPKTTLTWANNNLSYVIISYYGNSIVGSSSISSQIVSEKQRGMSWTSGDLSFNAIYTFTMTPYNSTGSPGISKTIILNTTPSVTVFNAAGSTSSYVQLQWYGTYYYVRIFRKVISPYTIDYVEASSNTKIYNMPFIDDDLSGNTTYSYYLQPYDNANNSYSVTNTITVKTKVRAPTDLSLVFCDSSGISISFTLPKKNSYINSYYYKLNVVYYGDTVTTSTSAGLTSPLIVTGLSSETTYVCFVSTYLDGVFGSNSYEINVTTSISKYKYFSYKIGGNINTFFGFNSGGSFAMSKDGKYIFGLFGSTSSSGYYYSTDYGTTWTNVNLSTVTGRSMYNICCSWSGQYVYIACGLSDFLYSSNYGVSFNRSSTYYSIYNYAVCCDSTGQYVYIGSYSSNFMFSVNYGAYIITIHNAFPSALNINSSQISCSSDGLTIVSSNSSQGSATPTVIAKLTLYSASTTNSLYASAICWYKFDEQTGTTITDSIGTYTTTCTNCILGVAGINNYAINLNNAGYVTISQSLLNNFTSFTIACWVYLTGAYNAKYTICSKQWDGNNTYAVLSIGYSVSNGGAPLAGSDGIVYFHTSNSVYYAASVNALNGGCWNHVAVVCTSTNCYIYINGVLNSTTAGNFGTLSDQPSVTNSYIGYWSGNPSVYFNGYIDNFAVWNTPLTAIQISSLVGLYINNIIYPTFSSGTSGINGNNNWGSAISQNGTYILINQSNNYNNSGWYLSKNGGATFSYLPLPLYNSNLARCGCAMSSTGQYMVVGFGANGSSSGGIYYSVNYGASWTIVPNSYQLNNNALNYGNSTYQLTMSPDGSLVIFYGGDGNGSNSATGKYYLMNASSSLPSSLQMVNFTNINAYSTVTTAYTNGNYSFICVSVCSDKSKMLMCAANGSLYYATYSAGSWTMNTTALKTGLSGSYPGCQLSSDGNYGVVVSGYGNTTYYAGLIDWTSVTPIISQISTLSEFSCCAISNDGYTIILGAHLGTTGIFYCKYPTWTLTQTLVTESQHVGIALSPDKSTIMYCTDSGYNIKYSLWNGTNYGAGISTGYNSDGRSICFLGGGYTGTPTYVLTYGGSSQGAKYYPWNASTYTLSNERSLASSIMGTGDYNSNCNNCSDGVNYYFTKRDSNIYYFNFFTDGNCFYNFTFNGNTTNKGTAGAITLAGSCVLSSAQYISGYSGSLYNSSTTGSYAILPTLPPNNFGFSICFWFYYMGDGTLFHFCQSSNTTNRQIRLDYSSSSGFQQYSYTYSNNTGWKNLVLNNWYHIAWVFTTSSSGTCYVNGTSAFSIGGINYPPTTSIAIFDKCTLFGNYYGSYSTGAKGYINDFRYYDGILDSTAVNAIYNRTL